MKPWLKGTISIVIPLLVGGLASLFTINGITNWYPTIAKPAWTPPNGLFAPVWTALYILMGIAFYIIWTKSTDPDLKRRAMRFWALQLLLNGLWSLLFFSLHRIGLALVDILILWVTIVTTIFLFARVSKLAAWLLVPYISWVSFAVILNFSIWQLNR